MYSGAGARNGSAAVVQCTMFYVLIFSLAAVILVIAFATAVTRRRRSLGSEEAQVGTGAGHGTHAGHADAAGRKNRKAKRAQSRHDRRQRH